jgi:hypothetical protein
MNCFDCNKQMDLYYEFVVCYLVGDKMEYICEVCSEVRQQEVEQG